MSVEEMKEEIKHLESRLAYLETRIKEIQQHCQHHFEGNQYVETCSKCNKVNTLYY